MQIKLTARTSFSEFNIPELDEEEIRYVMGGLMEVNGKMPLFAGVLERYEKLLGRLVVTKRVQVGDAFIKDYYTIQGEWLGHDAKELWIKIRKLD
jgi:hypothetical protein